jgi:hypothetical protein
LLQSITTFVRDRLYNEKTIYTSVARDGFLGFGWHSCPGERKFRPWNVPHQKTQETPQEAQEKEEVLRFADFLARFGFRAIGASANLFNSLASQKAFGAISFCSVFSFFPAVLTFPHETQVRFG